MKLSTKKTLLQLVIFGHSLLFYTSLSAQNDSIDANPKQLNNPLPLNSNTQQKPLDNPPQKNEISLNNDAEIEIETETETEVEMEAETDVLNHANEDTEFGTLESTYLQLSFQQGNLNQHFQQGEQHQAIAQVSSKGTGQMYIGWEIVQPPFSSQVDPVFVPIKRAQNMIAGHQKTDFLSPILPSNQLGKYLVRVNVTTPKNGEQSAVLRYYVTQKNTDKFIKEVQLRAPISGINADRNTLFKWQVTSNRYQSSLQIFENKRKGNTCTIRDSQQYVTAIATRGMGSTKITPIAAHKLQDGQSYCWRVQDYENGRLVASSDSRVFVWQDAKVKPPHSS